MLSYTAITSLDGYVADADGNFDWSAPDAEVHRFVNDLQRPIDTFLFGRRMYEIMTFWEDPANSDGEPDEIVDYGELWRDTDKVVYSTTLSEVTTGRTRLERSFDPDVVRALPGTVTVGGPTLAAHALRAGIVDELCQFISPVIVGAGTRFLPDGLGLDLELVDQVRFGNGVVFLRYIVRA